MPQRTTREQREYERSRYIIRIAYGTACREAELCGHTHADIRLTEDGYNWLITGKGSKARMVPLDDELMEAIYRYRSYFNLGDAWGE